MISFSNEEGGLDFFIFWQNFLSISIEYEPFSMPALSHHIALNYRRKSFETEIDTLCSVYTLIMNAA